MSERNDLSPALPVEAAPASGGSGRDKREECWIIGQNERAAFKLLRDLTGGSFDFWDLAGPRQARNRQALATALEGKKVPVARCGVTVLRDAFFLIVKLNTNAEAWREAGCLASRERIFSDYAQAVCQGVR